MLTKKLTFKFSDEIKFKKNSYEWEYLRNVNDITKETKIYLKHLYQEKKSFTLKIFFNLAQGDQTRITPITDFRIDFSKIEINPPP